MTWSVTFCIGLSLVVSLLVLDSATGKTFHVPYACSVVYDYGDSRSAVLIGSGTILDRKVVAVSVDNLNQRVDNVSHEYFYERVNRIVVHAGSNFMDPTRVNPRPKTAQTRRAQHLYVPLRPSFKNATKNFLQNPKNLSREFGEIEYDVFGVAFNIGFLFLDAELNWNAYVFPILMPHVNVEELKRLTNVEISFLEQTNMPPDSCFTYSYNAALNVMRYHEVTYLLKKNCREAYCMQRFSKCSVFPGFEHLACFKSTTYIDVCPEARGAALYCERFLRSVMGILTSAPMCGQYNIPGVYTTLPLIMEFYQTAFFAPLIPSPTEAYHLEDAGLEQSRDT